MIAAKVANALALDWPRDRLELIVAVDGGADPGADATAERARAAGADVVLELPRGGKVRAQDAAVRAATRRAAGLLRRQRAVGAGRAARARGRVRRPGVGYACGRCAFVNEGGTNQEGLYWRYEMWLRARESALASVTAGNGAIYAVRPEAYIEVDPVMGHDLSFPFNMVKRGWRAVDVPGARATEKMVPSIEGEWARKRRMMTHAWPIVLRGGLLDPRGYPPLYALMVALAPGAALRDPAAARRRRAGHARAPARAGGPYGRRGGAGGAAGGGRRRAAGCARGRCCSRATTCSRPPSLAAGLYDHLRHGTEAGWDAPEGTR